MRVRLVRSLLDFSSESDPTGFLNDNDLARLFYPEAQTTASSRYQQPDWATVHQELKRKGVTKQLLWEEYTQCYPINCYSYSQYCDRYRHWLGQQKRSMRQIHKAGEKCFVDYCGPTVPIINPNTGEIRDAQIFVGVLGASNYTYADGTYSQSLPDWLGSHARMFDYFGGCPEVVIPDNLRAGVSKACRYDPQLNPSYQQLAEHYQVAIIPARPYKPKDYVVPRIMCWRTLKERCLLIIVCAVRDIIAW